MSASLTDCHPSRRIPFTSTTCSVRPIADRSTPVVHPYRPRASAAPATACQRRGFARAPGKLVIQLFASPDHRCDRRPRSRTRASPASRPLRARHTFASSKRRRPPVGMQIGRRQASQPRALRTEERFQHDLASLAGLRRHGRASASASLPTLPVAMAPPPRQHEARHRFVHVRSMRVHRCIRAHQPPAACESRGADDLLQRSAGTRARMHRRQPRRSGYRDAAPFVSSKAQSAAMRTS